MNAGTPKPLSTIRPSRTGSLYYKVALAVGCITVFAAVWMTAGENPHTAAPAAKSSLAPPHAPPVSPESPSTAVASPPTESSAAQAEPESEASPNLEAVAEQGEQRRDALRKLGAGPDAIPELVDAVRNDTDVRTRILAIQALRRAALGGNQDRAITDVLREASLGDDTVVVAHARSVLDQIQQVRGAR
jgi:hypothetical protein